MRLHQRRTAVLQAVGRFLGRGGGASGTASADEIAAAKDVSLAQFAPDLVDTDDDGDTG
jgi:hypothetical protein